MDQELERKVKLDDLPKSDDDFWSGAETAVHTLAEPKKCEHSFIHRTSREVECRNCHIGFFLGVGDEVKSGHVYIKGQFAV